ncbi:hypothetical protein ASwh1_264 [Aeromonas phage Aswh_1]|nr:hypothetical protein ASwh1_264 [Aeromonas phage Aswh_1]
MKIIVLNGKEYSIPVCCKYLGVDPDGEIFCYVEKPIRYYSNNDWIFVPPKENEDDAFYIGKVENKNLLGLCISLDENTEYNETSCWVRLGSYNIPNRNGRVIHITEPLLQQFKDKLPKKINHGQNTLKNNNFYDAPNPVGTINDISWELRDNGIMHVYGNISKYDNPVWDKFCGDHDFSLRAVGTIRKTDSLIHEDVSNIISWDLEDFDLIEKRF